MNSPILAPAAILVLWSLIMLSWTAGTRLPAMAKLGIKPGKSSPGGRGVDLDGVLPDSVNWKAHNYAHLMEQPTIFYATVGILALTGHGMGINATLAWIYVGLRVLHSLWQATVNTIFPVRFGLFMLSSLCLLVLAINAVRATLGA